MRFVRSIYSFRVIRQFSMDVHGVVPDVISKVPPATVQVEYASGAVASMGNELTPTEVKDRPSIKFAADASKLYTVVLTDPDAPSRANPKFGEWLHWLVVNVPGDNVDGGEIIDDYVGSGPPKGTGLHRYVFLVYGQPGKLTCDEPRHTKNSGKQRNNFKISDFAKKYGLGEPIAGNFYQAEWDDYVPKLYEQLKD